MNKENVYIEPEDDITDIITKIEKSKSKIVALVPPKKAGVFRSVVNIKLMAKAAKTAEKTIVLVTVDPSITKLAAASKIPVAKNLQSAPEIPELNPEDKPETESTEEIADDEESTEEAENTDEAEPEEDEEDEEEDEPEEKPKPKKSAKKSGKSGSKKGHKLLGWIKEHKKLSIIAAIILLGLFGFLIWALFFAPAVDVTVYIKTDPNNFSESLTLVGSIEDENAKEGKFFLEEKKVDNVQEIKFDATGEKNQGEKASGNVTFEHIFRTSGTYNIDSITINGLTFNASPQGSISWDEKTFSQCENMKGIKADGPDDYYKIRDEYNKNGCKKTIRVNVVASEAGTKYNIPKSCGWMSLSGVSGCSEGATTGGTDKTVKVVQQSDIIKAQEKIKSANEEEDKKRLYETISDDSLIIESTFSQSTSNPEVTPGVDEEVKEGVQPTLKATTTASVYIIDKTKLEEYIKEKVDLRDDQKIIEIRDIYIDGISEIKAGATGKLKAKYYVGPKITESELVDKIKGLGLGDANREIRDLDAVSDVTIDKSYPWVFAVPTNSNKITIRFEITDQEGHKVGEDEEENSEDENSEEENSEDNSEESEQKEE